MPQRRRAANSEGLLGFLSQCPQAGLDTAPDFLLSLARGPDSVFDLHDAAGRALVAVLTDSCDNAVNATELMVLACAHEGIGGPLMTELLGQAILEAERGPRTSLELALTGAIQPHEALLRERGFRPRYAMMTMDHRQPWQPVEAPAGWTWTDLSADRYDEARLFTRTAFAGLPGVFFAQPEQGRARAMAKAPPDRLLFDGADLVGFASVCGEPDGSGLVNTIARHPERKGRGLGAVLMTEALRQLGEAGLRPARLHVAVENERALALYERFGFVTTETMPVYSVETA